MARDGFTNRSTTVPLSSFRDGDEVDLQLKNQKSLNRFFLEVVAGLGPAQAGAFRAEQTRS